MAKNVEKLIFRGLYEKHAVQRGIWVPTQHLLWDQGKYALINEILIRSVGLSLPDRKHITSPLRTQQVNAIYRFVKMEY
jgi:hypothetical protein